MFSRIPYQQRGASIAGVMFIIIFVALVATIAFRVVPLYLEYQGVLRSINHLKGVQGFPFDKGTFYKKLENQFYLNDVKISGADTKKGIKIERDKKTGEKLLVIKYEREAPFFKNIYFNVKFENISPAKPVAD